MTAPTDLTIAALLVSRVCHDLSAPAGAVGNGIEMLRDDGADGLSDALELLEFSSNETLRRLQYFRLAFGAAGGLGATTPVAELRDAATAYFAERKAALHWPNPGEDNLSQGAAKLALNLILLAADALPRGGTVSVEIGGDRMRVTAVGDRPTISEASRDALRGDVPEGGLTARVVQPFFTGALARAMGGEVGIDEADSRIALAARVAP
ncbi:MAG: histidine phosphotransferase family protein [Proteobacteria bacterium]|nr:histidine phosphotransferase family protein [Pseudomonadota bacterium]